MYFKKLELFGFKSFSEKTTLHFEPGITAVVGPNGCGKSNIFDSIRWVLGEQSAKSLRGSEMLDVIFNGTDKHEALGMAEVTLTFDNKARFFNFDNDEVAITRRLFRSGESEYLLNKNQVRLKDILDLLLGTGIGAESYSIIAQGKIDLVLSSKPEERRMVFDEASGITKYKSQKREATRKLEDTEQNLLRVNDIVTEVKRQIGSLERQANKARRYKEIFEELKDKEITYAFFDKNRLFAEKANLIKSLEELKAKEALLLEEIHQQEFKISSRSSELKSLEDGMLKAKNDLMNIENDINRNNEKISFNHQRIDELSSLKKELTGQLMQLEAKLKIDEDKLTILRDEYSGLRSIIEDKTRELSEKDAQLSTLALSIKGSLENISLHKKEVIGIVGEAAHAHNQITEFKSNEQVYLARKKRLQVEKAKAYEEKVIAQEALTKVSLEVDMARKEVEDSLNKINAAKLSLQEERVSLDCVNSDIESLEKQKLALESHKAFLEELKAKYLDKAETVNAVVYLDKLPSNRTNGLVIQINNTLSLNDEDKAYLEPANFKLTGEAKPIELDTHNIELKINKIEEELKGLGASKQAREARIDEINKDILRLEQALRSFEINLANKETSKQVALEQFNKISEEEDLIVLDLSEAQKELDILESNIKTAQAHLLELNNRQKILEDSISKEEENISLNNKLREELLVLITQVKTEVEGLNKRIVSDEATLRLLEDTFAHDRQNFDNANKQIQDAQDRVSRLEVEIEECNNNLITFKKDMELKRERLNESEKRYQEFSSSAGDMVLKVEGGRRELDNLRNRLHELQIQEKDLDYKYESSKERIMQGYKIDLDIVEIELPQIDPQAFLLEIEALKGKLNSCGTVNLVAIEEYDELKKRYDFLIQQQSDLTTAKASLHQAILKINRTTKQMFLETFEKVRGEFRNYFRLLFNGGDAQLYLIDENDPLESGIEIICRPPGKKLQNVLLLSGGEKSMAAIALIFAIFKVKPSPFCILDEIDAALDEANVDRFARALTEFSQNSQFIVITHNKKTIVNSDVMYGITMEDSGVSKIVSVKFAKEKEREVEEVAV
ncbi:MAG: AAA family ATPase [Candidatus Omnitrophota bacterium]